MPFVETSTGARLHYEEQGTGEVVVALHGLLGTARIDLGSVMDALSRDYRVIGLTLRGYGESQPKPRTFPPDFCQRDAADVLAALDALALDRVHIIGYSDGGEVALIAAAQQPERFQSVAVWGSIGVVPASLRPDPERLGSIPGVEDLRRVAEQVHGIADPESVIAEWVTSYTHIIDSGGDLSLSQANRLTMPVLLMLGDSDDMAPLSDARTLAARLPHGRLEVFGGGHAVHVEHPSALIAQLRAFWSQ